MTSTLFKGEMTISKTYHFEAGHHLPLVRDGHKCKRQHGHNYRVDVVLSGEPDQVGFLIDFWDLDTLVAPHIGTVDHQNLNDIPGLENPTAENIVVWLYTKFRLAIADYDGNPSLHLESVTVWETERPECWARYAVPRPAKMTVHST